MNLFETELEVYKQKRMFYDSKLKSISLMSNILKSSPPSSFFQIVVSDPPSINSIHFGITPNKPFSILFYFFSPFLMIIDSICAHQVNWSEINMAWGHCALLLKIFAEKLNYEFVQFVFSFPFQILPSFRLLSRFLFSPLSSLLAIRYLIEIGMQL